MESGKASKSESRFKGLRIVNCTKIESLPMEGTRMDAQKDNSGKRGLGQTS